jgi:3-(3-hydroxy-phenyl)propionate hydroxylase
LTRPGPAERHRSQPPAQAGDGFVYPRYAYRTPPELGLATGAPRRHPIVIVGAGMVGLTLAADLGSRGVPCVVLDDNDTVSNGSRAIGQARKSLQVWDRSGAAAPMARKGLSWNFVRYLHGDRVVADHALYPEPGHKFPPMMVLPQYHVESFLVDRCAAFGGVDIRWKNAARAVVPDGDHVRIEVDTPDGRYALQADWVVAADGVGSTVRRSLGLPFQGTKVEDRFVIVDVKVADDFPPGRSFWFKQSFHDGNSTLFLRQPDDVCRIDFNIGPDADAEAELSPPRVLAKLQAMFGPRKDFDIKWVSLYTVEVRRLPSFREGRVFFIGDAAHQLSPFSGGRGGNSGVEDADNLGWKLQRVIEGRSPPALLDSYDAERIPIADQNIRYSLRASEFISPSFAASAVFQEATLTLAARLPFARALINSGRFSTPAPYADSPLSSADDEADGFAAERVAPGCAAIDAPVAVAGVIGSLVEMLGRDFCLMAFGLSASAVAALRDGVDRARVTLRLLFIETVEGAGLPLREGESSCLDAEGLVRERYGLAPQGAYLFRPDQRIAGRWREPDPSTVGTALAKACALASVTPAALNPD